LTIYSVLTPLTASIIRIDNTLIPFLACKELGENMIWSTAFLLIPVFQRNKKSNGLVRASNFICSVVVGGPCHGGSLAPSFVFRQAALGLAEANTGVVFPAFSSSTGTKK
jgi:hypothetical protein